MFDWLNYYQKLKTVRRRIVYLKQPTEIILLQPCLSHVSLNDALHNRRSRRLFSPEIISQQELSNILWSANGVNLKIDNKHQLHTAPTASNHQEITLYVFDENGCYHYQPETHSMFLLFKGDVREFIGKQDFVSSAPIIIVLVADYSKMNKHGYLKKLYYSRIDCGYVSQNIYLYCAIAGLATVACGMINRKLLKNILNITNGYVILCHPVGREI